MNFSQPTPIFMQIAELVISSILLEKLRPDEKIPSVREMASQVQVNPNTVQRAYAWLQERELIYNQRGVGYFVDPGAYLKSRELKKEEFVNEYLPELVNRMKLLNISFEELKELVVNK